MSSAPHPVPLIASAGTPTANLRPATSYIDLKAAFLLVVANMIGTGVFTTLGFQAAGVPNGAALLLLWALGAIVALCGALSYAELAAAMPRNGGEYHFLASIYHQALGKVAGFVSISVGFSAPVALAAVALGRYAGTALPLDPAWIALAAVLIITLLHALNRELGRKFQVGVTALKIGVILAFCVFASMQPRLPGTLSVVPDQDTLKAIFSPAFGMSLVYVFYAYAGWNATAYVVGEVKNPSRTVPLALVLGSLLVGTLYLLLNWVFLRSIPLAELIGTIEVGAVSARNLYGIAIGDLLALTMSLLLLSTVSAMILAGPRVIQRFGEDIPALSWLGARNRRGAPTHAMLFQLGLVTLFILTDSFETMLTLAGFTVTLMSWLVVAGLMVLRRRAPHLKRPFRVPWYPLPPLIFLVMSGFSMLAAALQRPILVAAVLGGLLAVGLGFYRYGEVRRGA
ncbi:MAG TPA: amino acid permease [Chromatiaceae bacterium]|jgi:APA family basic amino acid/polyamine antiporter|nr:MAG: APC family permease [Thiohalocapsa sp. PB-PSB1]HBG97056.1 amino acid permease [Chromatiaceae bacterium]HCS89705.1 amino acid permease [Chromatiaceae bacterium]